MNNQLNMMEVPAFLHYKVEDYYEAGFRLYPFDMSKTYEEMILVAEVTALVPAYEAPSTEFITGKLVASLNNKKAELLAETHMRVKALDERIQQLLSITHQK